MAESKNNEFKGGGGGGRRMAGRPRPKVDNPGLLFKRIMSYVFKYYGIQMIVVLICKVVPELSAPGRFSAMPPFWGFVGTIVLNSLLCLGLGSLFDRRRRKRA